MDYAPSHEIKLKKTKFDFLSVFPGEGNTIYA